MFTTLKINTALLICLAFVFRLLFVNIGLLATFNTPQNAKLLTKQFSTAQKRRRSVEATVQPNTKDYSVVEVCEEGSGNEEDLVKASSPAILSIFYSFFKRIIFIPKTNHSFDLIKCDLYPKKYLALSILKI